MKNKVIIPGILFLIVTIFSVIMITQNNKTSFSQIAPLANSSESQAIILFYGDGCPHCLIVEEYLDSNNVSEQVQYAMKEVYYNQVNATELGEKAKFCGISTNSIGVPFLWDGSSCYVGDQDIIDFFKLKLNIK
jgi:glutaredoxin